MDKGLAYEFRKKVNEDNMIYHIFINKNNNNKWNILCSAMDWIEVALEGIEPPALSRGNDNKSSVGLITFVSCIDILWEAIQQTHRVLFDTTEIPFKDDSSIFKQDVSDNIYFKTIRACFAAHPVNLQKVFSDDDRNERRFASWPRHIFSKKDFSVILYSNIPKKESRFFDVSFSELMEFAKSRYSYLNELMKQIEKIVVTYKNDYRKIIIEPKTEVSKKISLLIEENKKRQDCDYYALELNKLRVIFAQSKFQNPENQKVVDAYQNYLLLELEEIQSHFQDMSMDDLDTAIEVEYPPKYHYMFSKLEDSVLDEGYAAYAMKDMIVEELNECICPIAIMENDMTLEEMYVLFLAANYVKYIGTEITEDNGSK
jgi:hypothetical protein